MGVKQKIVHLYNRSSRSHMIAASDLITGHNPARPRNPLDRNWDWIDPGRTVGLKELVGLDLLKRYPKEFKRVMELDEEQENDDLPQEPVKAVIPKKEEVEEKPKARKKK